MEHLNVFDTSTAKIYDVRNQLKNITKFLVENRTNIRLDYQDYNEILKTKVLSYTPISNIFENMLNNRKFDIFAPLSITTSFDTPELLTLNHISIDVKQLKDFDSNIYKVISSLPEFKDKLIVNLTPMLKRLAPNQVSDMNNLQSLFVRGLLIRSYYNSKNWLTPALIKYLSKSYSMTISAAIARNHNLTYNEQLVVATILTTYFHILCYSDIGKDTFPVTIQDCEYLGTRSEITLRLEDIAEKLENSNNIDIATLCSLIATSGPERLKHFNIRVFYNICNSLGSDPLDTRTGLEYPPYWAHQVLLALSGTKSGLFFAMKKQGKLVDEGRKFAEALNRASSFIPVID